MSYTSELLEQIERRSLDDIKQRRDSLGKAIAKLEYELDHPRPPIKVDFGAIKEEARKTNEFLDKCKRRQLLNKEVNND